jgi:hypothetical protein
MSPSTTLERRRISNVPTKSSELPLDFVKMVREVLEAHFDEGLKALNAPDLCTEPSFVVSGAIWPDEIILSATLVSKGSMNATTVHASVDFDPKASSPTLQDQLNLCVDAIGGGFQNLFGDLNTEQLEKLAHGALSAWEDIPFDWAKTDIEKKAVWLRVDKSNPALDTMADDWLSKNDPEFKKQVDEEESETKDLFVSGPKDKSDPESGSGFGQSGGGRGPIRH